MIKIFLLKFLKIYQKYMSPLKVKATCRFYPSCSQYMIDAINKYGIFKGVYLGLKRILRCNPFHPGGYDPVK